MRIVAWCHPDDLDRYQFEHYGLEWKTDPEHPHKKVTLISHGGDLDPITQRLMEKFKS